MADFVVLLVLPEGLSAPHFIGCCPVYLRTSALDLLLTVLLAWAGVVLLG